MHSIDQYYELARRELEQLSLETQNAALSMAGRLDTHPHDRPLPGVSDMLTRLQTAQRLLTRYQVLCELGIQNVSGCFPEPVSFTKLEPPK